MENIVARLAAEGFEITVASPPDTPGHVCSIRNLVPVDGERTAVLEISPGQIGSLRQLLAHVEQLYNRR